MKLDREIGAFQLCMITIGMAISGQFFGWNYALAHASLINVLIATCLIGLFYLCFMFCCAELATTIPNAGGPYAFVSRAFGQTTGYLAGIATLCEYGFGIPAIAVAIGSYTHFLFPSITNHIACTFFILLFMFINLIGTRGIVIIELIATLLALLGLVIFYCIGFYHFPLHFLERTSTNISIKQIEMAIPFLMWIFLAVEGGALTAEEVKSPEKNISRGLCFGMIVLFVCSLLTVFFIGAYTSKLHELVDFPLAEVLGLLFGRHNVTTLIVSSIGLFGLIAALNGLMIACSREMFALARANHLPAIFSQLSKKHVPTYATIVPCLIAVVCAYSANLANALVTLSVMNALLVYGLTTCAHIKLRLRAPNLNRPFKAWFPLVPLVSLIIGFWCFVCIMRYVIFKESLIIFNWHIPLIIIASLILFLSMIVYYQRRLTD